MSFNRKILVIAVLIVLAGFSLIFFRERIFYLQSSEISREEIAELLKKNKDSLNYIEKYKDFEIEEKTLLTKEDILEGQKGERFKEVYEGLELEDNRYLKVDLINQSRNRGLIAVLDLKNKEVSKAYGLILLQGEMQK